jgi:NADH dehydrogenase/NADH:ubiquinone oxidoreductase subunit G
MQERPQLMRMEPIAVRRKIMKAIQISLQVPEYTVKDLDMIANLLQISREQLLTDIIEREAAREKERLLMELGTLYAQDRISKADLVEMIGEALADEMELIKGKTKNAWAGAVKHAKRAPTTDK